MKLIIAVLVGALLKSNAPVRPPFTLALDYNYVVSTDLNSKNIWSSGAIRVTNFRFADDMVLEIRIRDNFGTKYDTYVYNYYVTSDFVNYFGVTFENVNQVFYIDYSYTIPGWSKSDSRTYVLKVFTDVTQVITMSTPGNYTYNSGMLGYSQSIDIERNIEFELLQNTSSSLFDLKWLRFYSPEPLKIYKYAQLRIPRKFSSGFMFNSFTLALKTLPNNYYSFDFSDKIINVLDDLQISRSSTGNYQLFSVPKNITSLRMYLQIFGLGHEKLNLDINLNVFFHHNTLGACGSNNEFCINFSSESGQTSTIVTKSTYEV